MSGSKPACWDNATNWAEWQRLNSLAGSAPGEPLNHFCADCTPEYQRKAKALGTCAYPTVTFYRLIERRRDPVTDRLRVYVTSAVAGKRSPEDEAEWARRHKKQEAERAAHKAR